MHENMIGGAVLTNWLAILGLISLLYWAWRISPPSRQRRQRRPGRRRPRPPPVPTALAPVSAGHLAAADEDIAVIAAAVYAMLGTHRIVHLEAIPSGKAWEIEGRWTQQTSHNLR